MSAVKQYYSRIFSQAVSTDEKLLAIGNSEGNIVIFDLKHLLNGDGTIAKEKLGSPKHIYSAFLDPIYSMASSQDFLVTGTTGVISGCSWKDLGNGISKPAWTINLECDQSNFGTPEINSIVHDPDKNCIYAACGDWRTRCYDLETGKQIMMLEGHDDYVHDIALSSNQVTTCGEDGQVLVWDSRSSKEPKIKLQPYSQSALQRPVLGKFIASVDVENDWLVCGGGPKAGIFHMRSLALTAVMPSTRGCVSAAQFTRHGTHRGSVIVAGNDPTLKVCSISGDITAEIPTSCPFVYSVHITKHPAMMMTVGGSGPNLDVCFNLNYRDHSTVTF